MRVLSIVHSSVFGGPHNQASQLRREFLKSGGPEITVLMPEEIGTAPDRLRAADVDVVQMPLMRPRASRTHQSPLGLIRGYPRQIRALRRLISERGYDVIEVHGLLNIDGAVAGRLEGRGVVWQLIDTRPPMLLRWLMMPIVLALADVIMTTGAAVAAEYPGARLRPNRLITFIPPVRPERLDAAATAAVRRTTRERLRVSDGAVLIVSIGNLNPQKGFEDLLNAVAACRNDANEIEVRIRGSVQVGHEAYASSLRRRAQSLGLSPQTVGVLEEGISVADVMHGADIFALSSRAKSEGLPTVVLEAMSAALSVVATDVGSVAELVLDGYSGIVVPPSDPIRLAGALTALVENPTERQRLGRTARDVVEQLAMPSTFASLQRRAYELARDRHGSGHRKKNGT